MKKEERDMSETKDLQVKTKQGVDRTAEQTMQGPVFTPEVDIFENETRITLLADMPGVNPQDIVIDLRDNVLTISGDVKPWESGNETDILVEFEIGRFFRQFTVAETIDQSKIEASSTDGVLRLVLPKEAKATPRKISVKAA
jgi:HSP20 family molecular chaperone IbpA